MRHSLYVILLGWTLLVLPASAQEETAEVRADLEGNSAVAEVTEASAQADPASAEGDELSAVGADDDDDDDDDNSPEYEDDLDVFIPTREIPPDEQVTFPVDI